MTWLFWLMAIFFVAMFVVWIHERRSHIETRKMFASYVQDMISKELKRTGADRGDSSEP